MYQQLLFFCWVRTSVLKYATPADERVRWCGTGTEYCAAPDCQFRYGPGCDANQVPAGVSTASVPRPALGSVPYGGAGIYDCAVPGGMYYHSSGDKGRADDMTKTLPSHLTMAHTATHLTCWTK